MRIEFDPTNPIEAAAVRAMLTAMAPTPDNLFARLEAISVERKALADSGEPMPEDTDHSADATDPDTPPSVDGSGEPHDPRIHSTPPKLNADGTWRAKRNVTADQIAAVRAEREQTYDTDVTPEGVDQVREKAAEALANADLEPVVSAPPAPPAPTGQSADPEPVVSTPNVAAPADGAPSPAPSFLDVMKAITAAQKDGKIDTAKVKELCATVGAG